MKSLSPPLFNPKTIQRGSSAVEFALVAIPFFLLVFGAMEFGRLMYVWNTVQEVTRNAARRAVVTDFTNDTAIAKVKQAAVFDASALPGAPEITSDMVKITYLNEKGQLADPRPLTPGDNIAACLDATRIDSCIKFVEVCLAANGTSVKCPHPSDTPSDQTYQPIPFVPMLGLFSKECRFCTDLTGLKIPLSTVRMPAESLGYQPGI